MQLVGAQSRMSSVLNVVGSRFLARSRDLMKAYEKRYSSVIVLFWVKCYR